MTQWNVVKLFDTWSKSSPHLRISEEGCVMQPNKRIFSKRTSAWLELTVISPTTRRWAVMFTVSQCVFGSVTKYLMNPMTNLNETCKRSWFVYMYNWLTFCNHTDLRGLPKLTNANQNKKSKNDHKSANFTHTDLLFGVVVADRFWISFCAKSQFKILPLEVLSPYCLSVSKISHDSQDRL